MRECGVCVANVRILWFLIIGIRDANVLITFFISSAKKISALFLIQSHTAASTSKEKCLSTLLSISRTNRIQIMINWGCMEGI